MQRFLGAIGAGSGRFSGFRIERFGEDHPAPRGARKEGVLIVEKDGTPLRIEQLSEGEKNTILLISDLARRFSEANPGREDPLTGSGIVLIDEIDAHLHPGWQRGFLPALEDTFPGCQFIVSTHSPQVLSRVKGSQVFIFQNFKRVEITPYTYGRDSSSILSELMAVTERPDDVTAKIHDVAELIEAERSAPAPAGRTRSFRISGTATSTARTRSSTFTRQSRLRAVSRSFSTSRTAPSPRTTRPSRKTSRRR